MSRSIPEEKLHWCEIAFKLISSKMDSGRETGLFFTFSYGLLPFKILGHTNDQHFPHSGQRARIGERKRGRWAPFGHEINATRYEYQRRVENCVPLCEKKPGKGGSNELWLNTLRTKLTPFPLKKINIKDGNYRKRG